MEHSISSLFLVGFFARLHSCKSEFKVFQSALDDEFNPIIDEVVELVELIASKTRLPPSLLDLHLEALTDALVLFFGVKLV